MAISIPNILKSASRYTASHPKVLGQIARFAFQRRMAIPLDSLRWLVRELPQKKSAPKDITLVSQDPGLGLGLTLDLMGTELRVDMVVLIDHIHATTDSLQVTMRVHDLRATVLNNLEGNVAKMLKSGFFDLSKPANLVNSPMLGGKKPAAIVDAKDDLFVIDLMRVPNIAKNPTIQKALATLTPVLSVSDVRAKDDLLLIGLRATPSGIRESFAGLRS